MLSLRICLCVLGPLPRWLPWCMYPFLPTGQRPSQRSEPVGAPQPPYASNFRRAPYFEAAVIRSSSGPQIGLPSRLLLPQSRTGLGSHGFYVHAYLSLLPP